MYTLAERCCIPMPLSLFLIIFLGFFNDLWTCSHSRIACCLEDARTQMYPWRDTWWHQYREYASIPFFWRYWQDFYSRLYTSYVELVAKHVSELQDQFFLHSELSIKILDPALLSLKLVASLLTSVLKELGWIEMISSVLLLVVKLALHYWIEVSHLGEFNEPNFSCFWPCPCLKYVG